MKTKTEITDIHWDEVEAAIVKASMSAKTLRDKFGKGISPITFRRWCEKTVGRKFRIDWGTQGRFNRVRPKTKAVANSPLPLEPSIKSLVSEYGVAAVLRELARTAYR